MAVMSRRPARIRAVMVFAATLLPGSMRVFARSALR
jgi:hypothetical protein